MTDDMTPALTAEEWALRKYERPRGSHNTTILSLSDGCVEIYSRTPHKGEVAEVEDCHALAALALSALPEGHPGKLTREMVEMLEHAVSVWAGQPRVRDDAARSEYAIMTGALAALRVLLPPRT